MRLFAALRPDARALDHLAGALVGAGVGEGPAGGVAGPGGSAGTGGPPPLRVVPPTQQHVTLAFYGEVPAGAVDDLTDALRDEVRALGLGPDAGRATLAGAGVFSGRTLWVGVRDEPAGLVRSLAVAAADAAAVAGVRLPDEDRPRFRAHLTVARRSARGAGRRRERDRRDRDRRRGPRRDGPPAPDPLDGPAHALAVYVGPSWPVAEVQLVASRLGEGAGGGPLHELVARLPL